MDYETLRPWVLPFEESPRTAVRLLCFPYAGGGAGLYRAWRRNLPATVSVVPVELPGRESRFREPAISEMGPLVDTLASVLGRLFTTPFAFFGHSMGALVAFELARRLQRDRGISPVHLFLSGRRPPDLAPLHAPFFALPRDQFVDRVQHWYDAFPAMVLERPALLDPFLPTLRADMKLLDTYVFQPGEALACPITALGGLRDHAAPPASLRGWARHTHSETTQRVFPGRHFYIRDAADEVCSVIDRTLGG